MTPHEKAALKKMIDDLTNAAEVWGEAEGEKYHEDEDDADYGADAADEMTKFETLRGVVFTYIDSLK